MAEFKKNERREHQYPKRSVRISDEEWQWMLKEKARLGLSWNLLIRSLRKKGYENFDQKSQSNEKVKNAR